MRMLLEMLIYILVTPLPITPISPKKTIPNAYCNLATQTFIAYVN